MTGLMFIIVQEKIEMIFLLQNISQNYRMKMK